jgi:hypothetical protein
VFGAYFSRAGEAGAMISRLVFWWLLTNRDTTNNPDFRDNAFYEGGRQETFLSP